MSSPSQIRGAVRRALMLSAAAATASLPAVAQVKPEAAPQVETIVVTGSRIPQAQLESASPVTSISSEAISQTGVTRVEDLLNTLPQVAGQYGAGVSNGATGEATVSLRGLGALLEEMESRRRQAQGVDDRVEDPLTGQQRPPRPGYGNADPWYDGRGHDYTIIDSPRSGTWLSADEIEAAFLQFGGADAARPVDAGRPDQA